MHAAGSRFIFVEWNDITPCLLIRNLSIPYLQYSIMLKGVSYMLLSNCVLEHCKKWRVDQPKVGCCMQLQFSSDSYPDLTLPGLLHVKVVYPNNKSMNSFRPMHKPQLAS